MLGSLAKGLFARRAARFLPGGWLTVAALSPRGRSAIRGAWNRGRREVSRRRGPR